MQLGETAGPLPLPVAKNTSHGDLGVVIKDGLRNAAKEAERPNMAVAEGFRRLGGVADHEAGVRVRQVKSEEVDLALHAADDADSFAKVDLGMSRRMLQRHKHLLSPLTPAGDVIPTAALADSRGFPWRGFSDALGAKEIRAMPSAVKLRDGYSAEELRALAKRSKDANQSRRLLSLAAVRDGMERGEAAKIGGMDRQTLRDWVHRFNASGPDGLIDNRNASGPTTRLPPEQLRAFAKLVEAGPDREVDGVVRWRRVDLKLVIAERFGVDYHERTVGKLLKKLGFSHMSARPRHPAQDERIVEAYKKTSRAR